MDRRTDGRDKIPLFYRISPPSGPLPKKRARKAKKEKRGKREKGEGKGKPVIEKGKGRWSNESESKENSRGNYVWKLPLATR